MQFRVGDKVRRVRGFRGRPIANSRVIGTVVEVQESFGTYVRVQWARNKCWIRDLSMLELVEDDSPIAG